MNGSVHIPVDDEQPVRKAGEHHDVRGSCDQDPGHLLIGLKGRKPITDSEFFAG